MARNSLKVKVLAIILLSLISFFAIELLLRTLGFSPHQPIITHIKSSPSNALIPHTKYGLALQPGNFNISLNEKLKYNVTHLSDNARACFPSREKVKNKINFYGCSFTYGMGVNDSETFPSLIQGSLLDVKVSNYAVPGYGTIHSLLQLEQHIESGAIPEVVLLGYTSVQDARNMLTGIQQKYWTETLSSAVHPNLQTAAFPFVRKKRGALKIDFKPLHDFDRPWKWSAYSSFIYRLETLWSNIYYGFTDKYKLTESIVEKMNTLCKKNNITFFIVGLDTSDSLTKMKAFCASKSINFIDAALDIYDNKYNLKPWDAHPNTTAHSYYANKILERLKPYIEQIISLDK